MTDTPTDDDLVVLAPEEVVIRSASAPWWLVAVLIAMGVLTIMAMALGYRELRRITANTNTVVTQENTRKDDEIADLQAQLDGLTFVLQEQAVPAIIAMGDQITALGGDPPEVILDPSQAPP